MIRGQAFWRKDEDSPNIHLRFVISAQNVDGLVLVVSMSTLHGTGREDESCILEPGDHRATKVRSYIRFDKAFEISYFKLVQEKLHGELTMCDDVSAVLLKRIQNGAQCSPALPLKFRKYFPLF